MDKHRNISIIGRKTGLRSASRAGFSLNPDEGLVKP